ncbi:hypothetical protein GALMADRAFT_713364 [Galerina marginata CBS 339.88]|uniref:Uncharacterized protein n=1 Tax=Galerina marginata (strain CBS 339.88) TaxID=685588 RepID=A0A067TMT7_GALM3|nr:hypothetical protein GALMADRAFT_713364 [Galerina marginata CBS 339.88]
MTTRTARCTAPGLRSQTSLAVRVLARVVAILCGGNSLRKSDDVYTTGNPSNPVLTLRIKFLAPWLSGGANGLCAAIMRPADSCPSDMTPLSFQRCLHSRRNKKSTSGSLNFFSRRPCRLSTLQSEFF